MLNPRKLMATYAIATAALIGIAGCQTKSTDERSEGRVLDDNQITQKIQTKLNDEPVYKFSTVEVKTFGGVVQLSGFVNMEEQRHRAEEIAKEIPEVHQVVNGIALKPEAIAPTSRTNTDLPRIYSQ